MIYLEYIWFIIQALFGYSLVLPIVLFVAWRLTSKTDLVKDLSKDEESDYAIIVTAYQQTHTLKAVVDSIIKMEYHNYLVYIVADNCDVTDLNFSDSRIILLRPEIVLASNTKSHQYALNHFARIHNNITIIDSDNLVHSNYLKELNYFFNCGYIAVQGVRKAKNINTNIAELDSVRDIYYHFYDGKLLFELGSSATLAGSGMAFTYPIYKQFLAENSVSGAGFDKVLQSWLVGSGNRIAFAENAIVFDEKTSKSDQLVQQRSRWINTWFKYFSNGFKITYYGMRNLNKNQFLFGIVLLRPPLFIFILISGLFMAISLFTFFSIFVIWLTSFLLFILGFYLSLAYSNANKSAYRSLFGVPKFIYLQVISLLKSRNANKNSVATTHYQDKGIDEV
ncbi:cellulose synthase/poly-beta-1,6-N-acetylglucosamine synthase-like glycosyltransferase [Pedobacter sp. UYP24]